MSEPSVTVIGIDEGARVGGVGLCHCEAWPLPFPAFLGTIQDPPTLPEFEMFLNMMGRNFHYVILRDLT